MVVERVTGSLCAVRPVEVTGSLCGSRNPDAGILATRARERELSSSLRDELDVCCCA